MTISWDALRTYLWGAKATSVLPAVSNTGTPGTGALLDTRTPEEQQTDIHFGEIVASAAVVTWTMKLATAWRTFPAFNQSSCDACVAFTMAKILGVMQFLKHGLFVTFSPGDIYRQRSNKNYAGTSNQGMNSTDPYAIAATGVTIDAVLPSQNLSEAQMNALILPEYGAEIASLFKISNPKAIVLPIGTIEAIASVIQATGKPVMVWFYFTAREWGYLNSESNAYNVPEIMDGIVNANDARALRHSVAAVDFTMYDGNKALIIEDSAWFGGYNRRVITEAFFSARNFFAAYPMNFAQEKAVNALPKYTFTKPLSFIPWSDAANAPANGTLNATQSADVKALQIALQAMTDAKGNTYFPTNVAATGYYGALTAAAVYAWQCDHLLSAVTQATLDSLAGKAFGSASIADMNRELS